VIDFDDYSATHPGHHLLLKLKEHFPNFKCTCFTPAFSLAVFFRKMEVEKFKEWGKIVAANSGWIEIAPHGFSHLKGEMLTKDKKRAEMIIKAIENLFGQLGIPFVKIFKAPHWQISPAAEEVLKERGYVLAIDRNKPTVHTDIPTYVWNWDIKDVPFPKHYPVIKAHGHIWTTPGIVNGLDECLPNLLQMPQNAKFQFISEYLKENGQDV